MALLLAGGALLQPSEPPAAKPPKPVRILTPAGGELYVIGSEQRVRLDPKTRSKQVTIELSTDGGTNFAPLGTIDNTVPDKSQRNVLSFAVPGPGSGRCVVRATAGGVSSLSPGFSIRRASPSARPASSRTRSSRSPATT